LIREKEEQVVGKQKSFSHKSDFFLISVTTRLSHRLATFRLSQTQECVIKSHEALGREEKDLHLILEWCLLDFSHDNDSLRFS